LSTRYAGGILEADTTNGTHGIRADGEEGDRGHAKPAKPLVVRFGPRPGRGPGGRRVLQPPDAHLGIRARAGAAAHAFSGPGRRGLVTVRGFPGRAAGSSPCTAVPATTPPPGRSGLFPTSRTWRPTCTSAPP